MVTSKFTDRWVYAENRVPHYQRLYQRNDGVRQWWKVSQLFMLDSDPVRCVSWLSPHCSGLKVFAVSVRLQ